MRTSAVKNPQGRPIHIGGGANAQDGSLKLYTCTTCGRPVVWATSTRTGRMYLANVFQGESGMRYYVKASAHECETVTAPAPDPEALAARRVELAEFLDMQRTAGENEALRRIVEGLRPEIAELEAR